MKLPLSTFSFFHHKPHFLPLYFSPFFSTTFNLNPKKPQPFNQILQLKSYPNNFIPQFYTLAKTLSLNPNNFKPLSQLDYFLSTHTKSFDLITSLTIFDGLCQLKKFNRAKDLFFHLRDTLKVSPFFGYSLICDCLVKDCKFDDVEVQWGEIGCGYLMNLSNYVINVCKCGDLEEIKRVCERVLMGSRVLDRQCYVALIGVLCSYNEGLMGKYLINEMYCRGFNVDYATYIVMFRCFCRNGDLNEADWVLRKMINVGFDVDVCMYESFMECLCRAGKFREASKLFTKLINHECPRERYGEGKMYAALPLHSESRETVSEVKRDEFSGCKSKLLKEGRRAIFQVKCNGVIPKMMVYEMYFRSLCVAGKLGDAEVLLKKMMKMRYVPQICVYGSFIKALFRANREEDALKFFKIECKKGLVCSNELARFVIVELCEKGEVDHAMKLFDDFTRKVRFINTVVLCNCLLGSLWSAGRTTEVEMFFDRMKNGDLVPPNSATYKLMVTGFCNQGNIRKGLEIFDEMVSKKFPIDRYMYELIITKLCNQGWLGEAYEYLERMTKSGSTISYTMWKRMLYSLISDVE